jgi:hypothetical protein
MKLKPVKAFYNEDRFTSSLFFGPDNEHLDGEYHMRGGICWPKGYDCDGKNDVMGYALLGGHNVKTKVVHIFEHRPFVIINSILDEEKKKVKYEGLAQWFNDNWSRYFARKYYWNQEDHIKGSHSSEIRRSKMIDPKPILIEADWSNIAEMYHALWLYSKRGTLKVYSDKTKHDSIVLSLMLSIRDMKKADKEALPGVHALLCLLAGLDKRPYIERKEY